MNGCQIGASVGASLLAINQRTPRGTCHPALSLTTIASELAPTGFVLRRRPMPSVGASLLAINQRTPRGTCQPALSLTTIASELAPTGFVFSPAANALCRSEPARDKPENTAGHLPPRVIVDDHRELAPTGFVLRRRPMPSVGASLLAINQRTPRGSCQPALSLTTIASKLAPTGFVFSPAANALCRSEPARDKPENTAGHLPPRVIVDDHREQARSYRVCVAPAANTICRSELARDKPESTAGHLPASVIVDDHRERARSYRVCVAPAANAICRSELARDKPENTAGHLPPRVIVDDHRERARSYSYGVFNS
ncbi:hypothetical protein AB7M25_003241 [Pseudomonas sp. AP3_22 TE3818]